MVQLKQLSAVIMLCTILTLGISFADNDHRKTGKSEKRTTVRRTETTHQNRATTQKHNGNSARNHSSDDDDASETANHDKAPGAGNSAGSNSGSSPCLACHATVPTGTPPHSISNTQQPAQGSGTATTTGSVAGTSTSVGTTTVGSSPCLACHASVPTGVPPHPIPNIQQPAQGIGVATSTGSVAGSNIGSVTGTNSSAVVATGGSECLACHATVPTGIPPHPIPNIQQPAQGIGTATSTGSVAGSNIGAVGAIDTSSGTATGGSECLACHAAVPTGIPPHPIPNTQQPAQGNNTAPGTGNITGSTAANSYKVLGWNNLGMHCLDADFSVFSLLPPYNTIHSQVIDPQGKLLKQPGSITVTYEAMADPGGSINTTSAGKTNFWDYTEAFFAVTMPVDVGLPVPGPASFSMPGAANTPQPMKFENTFGWFAAYGIPITPVDNSGNRNTYPMMRLTVKSVAAVTSADIVLPVSDEMDCSACHKSGTSPAARPKAGWVSDTNPQRNFRLNILSLHDDKQLSNALFTQALATGGFNSGGLYPSVVTDGAPILCARCHLSEALPNSGMSGIKPLTQVIHTLHAKVTDPTNNLILEAATNRSACYRCHPGSETRCLRGAMGKAVAPDGSMLMQCQSCHGSMSTVGAANRTGWLDEPTCQSCHTGTALSNNGQIRYNSVFDTGGKPRQAINTTFATNTAVPEAGKSLYRFSKGHGGLYCEACHGSTHAEFPTTSTNDNLYSIKLQGHDGPLAECQTCHASTPATTTGGPHGLHPIGQQWVEGHQVNGSNGCQTCHGADYRGTVLSRVQANRTFSAGNSGTLSFTRGQQIGCYSCHNGPGG